MDFKEKINKIHYDVSNEFTNVVINEKSSIQHGNYIELSMNENNKKLSVLIKKPDLHYKRFNWSYLSNPNNSKSLLIERNSSVESFIEDVKDIFEKNRFDSEYIKSINK